MTAYNVVLFTHITAVIVMFASLTADGLAIGGLRATDSAGPARAWVRALEISAAFGPWARLAVLAAGLYLAVDAWSWPGWIIVGLVGWTAFVTLGEPLTGRELHEMKALVHAHDQDLPPAVIIRLRRPRMWYAVLIRAGLGAGIVFCMAVKPPAAAAAAFAACGALAGVAAARLTLRPASARLLRRSQAKGVATDEQASTADSR
jgi:hypothetical protein